MCPFKCHFLCNEDIVSCWAKFHCYEWPNLLNGATLYVVVMFPSSWHSLALSKSNLSCVAIGWCGLHRCFSAFRAKDGNICFLPSPFCYRVQHFCVSICWESCRIFLLFATCFRKCQHYLVLVFLPWVVKIWSLDAISELVLFLCIVHYVAA